LAAQLEQVVFFGEALFRLVDVFEGGGEGLFDVVAGEVDGVVVRLEPQEVGAVAVQVFL
jgi:pantoate kinase